MKNYYKKGDVLTATAPAGGVKSGQFIVVGGAFGIAAISAAEGEEFELGTGHIFKNIPKIDTEDWDDLAPVYWNATESKATKVKSSNLKIGIAIGAHTNGTGDSTIRLNSSF
ncbi:DUF2190 family protein [Pseudovibrio ascidiaceicola]|uniref:DUF2190 family protein n=1 Tax=Pseudovibrio ascidiaceicola TaxID=285279 RepID=UPI003D35C28F